MNEEVVVIQLEQRVIVLEREVRDLKDRNDQHAKADNQRWDNLLIEFGKLLEKVGNLKGQFAGAILAGMILAAAVAVIANKVLP